MKPRQQGLGEAKRKRKGVEQGWYRVRGDGRCWAGHAQEGMRGSAIHCGLEWAGAVGLRSGGAGRHLGNGVKGGLFSFGGGGGIVGTSAPKLAESLNDVAKRRCASECFVFWHFLLNRRLVFVVGVPVYVATGATMGANIRNTKRRCAKTGAGRGLIVVGTPCPVGERGIALCGRSEGEKRSLGASQCRWRFVGVGGGAVGCAARRRAQASESLYGVLRKSRKAPGP